MTAARRWALLAAIVVVAAALRVVGLDVGLPNPAARPDEREMLSHTAGFPLGDLNPRWFIYPNLFFYVVYAWIEGVLAVRRLAIDTPPYRALLTFDLPLLLLAGRALSALVGTATVVLVYRLARRAGGTACGLVAAALLATCWLHVRDSHALKTEALLAAGVVVTIGLLATLVERPSLGAAVRAGVAIGVTTGMKYPGLFLLGPAWLADALTSARHGLARALPSRRLVALVGAAAAAVVVTCPFLVLDAGRAADTAELLSLALYATRPEDRVADVSFRTAVEWLGTRAFVYHLTVSLRHGCGLLVALALPVALVAAFRRPREPVPFLSAAFVVLLWLISGASPVHLARYFTPLTPLVVVLVAWTATRWLGGRPLALAAVTAALAAEPLWSSVQADRIMREPDTRVLATRWMTAHLPPTAVVAQLGTAIVPVGDPPLPPGVRRAHPKITPADFAAAGVTHVVTHDHVLPFSRLDPGHMAALGPHLRPLETFSPWTGARTGLFEREDAYYVPFARFAGVVRPGPEIRIYEFRRP